MYELPDLMVVARQMNEELPGNKIVAAQFVKPELDGLPSVFS